MHLLTVLAIGLGVSLAESKENTVDKRSSVCFGDLGCFSTGGSFTGLYRPVNLNPQSPQAIGTKFMLFTRKSLTTHSNLFYENLAGLSSTDYNASRPTKMIVHGFLDNGNVNWMEDMKNELLRYGDYNVVLVDWGGGSGIPYTQATANTRVVGAEIAQLIKGLQDQAGANPEDFHLIGHSLGAHIMGYAGERTLNLGRISGLDPADPYFQYMDKVVRLDPSDANFVDIIHSNGESFIKLGYGMIEPCGHVDYFPNGGKEQPGCDQNPVTTLRLEGDIYNGAKEVVACSHLRAYKLFTDSINSRCGFKGYGCSSYTQLTRGQCLPCTGLKCGFMGFHADSVKPPRGQTHVKYYLKTGATAPYCRYHYQVDVAFGNLPGAKTETGTLFMNLVGTNGQTGSSQLNTDSIEINPGHIYGFLVTAPHDIGELKAIGFKWETESHWYNPLTWSLLSTHSMHVNYVDVVNGETDRRKRICGFNAGIESSVSRSFTTSC